MGRGVVKMDVRVVGQPTVMFRLVDIEIVQDDVELLVWVKGHDSIHEVKKLPVATAVVVTNVYQSRGNLQSRKERDGAMPFIFMTEPTQRLADGQTQPALSSLQGLDRWLLVLY